MAQRTNWAGNYTYAAGTLYAPRTLPQVQEVVKRTGKLRVLGSGHSFNSLADSPEAQLSLANFDFEPVIDRQRHTVTVGGGVRYGEICRLLDNAGYALPNLASLPHISIAGAVATATHGSGLRNGTLATAVAALEVVAADGSVVNLTRDQDGEQFAGAVVGLGGLGVVTTLTLDLVPAFQVRQVVYENLPLANLLDHFDEIVATAYSVSLFTGWQGEAVQQVWLKQRVVEGRPFEPSPEFFGAPLAREQLHPIRHMPAEACTPQLSIAGPWYDRLPHFRLEFTPSSGAELQSEYLVPFRYARPALQALNQLQDRIEPLLQIGEIRTIAADNLWLSPCYGQDRVGFHFTWKKNWEEVSRLLPLIEEQLEPFEAAPHWGKLFTMPPRQVQALFPKLADFQKLLTRYDPQGKFRNAFLDRYIFGED